MVSSDLEQALAVSASCVHSLLPLSPVFTGGLLWVGLVLGPNDTAVDKIIFLPLWSFISKREGQIISNNIQAPGKRRK